MYGLVRPNPLEGVTKLYPFFLYIHNVQTRTENTYVFLLGISTWNLNRFKLGSNAAIAVTACIMTQEVLWSLWNFIRCSHGHHNRRSMHAKHVLVINSMIGQPLPFPHAHLDRLLAVWEKSVKAAWLFANWHYIIQLLSAVPFHSIRIQGQCFPQISLLFKFESTYSQSFVRYNSSSLQDIFPVPSNLVIQLNNVMDFTKKKLPLKHSSSLTYMAWLCKHNIIRSHNNVMLDIGCMGTLIMY